MKPYGSKKRTHYDTEPRIKSARAVESRRAEVEVDGQLEMGQLGTCDGWGCTHCSEVS